jgi:hypothetical protein
MAIVIFLPNGLMGFLTRRREQYAATEKKVTTPVPGVASYEH